MVGSQTSATSFERRLKLESCEMLNRPSAVVSRKKNTKTAANCQRIERGCRIGTIRRSLTMEARSTIRALVRKAKYCYNQNTLTDEPACPSPPDESCVSRT